MLTAAMATSADDSQDDESIDKGSWTVRSGHHSELEVDEWLQGRRAQRLPEHRDDEDRGKRQSGERIQPEARHPARASGARAPPRGATSRQRLRDLLQGGMQARQQLL